MENGIDILSPEISCSSSVINMDRKPINRIFMSIARRIVKSYLKRMSKDSRRTRMLFVGKNLRKEQHKWAHLTSHPWDKV